MSAVTASALIGTSPRYRGGIEPDTIALFHEGMSAAWQFLTVDLFDEAHVEPASGPAARWVQCHTPGDSIDMLLVGIHLWGGDPDSEIAGTLRSRLTGHGLLAQSRLDLAELDDDERQDLIRLARTPPGTHRSLMLSIYNGSSLATRGSSLLGLPGWQGEWAEYQGGQSYGYLNEDWRHHGN